MSSLSQLALQIPIEDLLIPPSTYLTDRRVADDIFAPYATGRRAFAARNPFPLGSDGATRFPRVLRETTSFVLLEPNITSEGIFRIPPNAKLRDVLKEAYDRGQKYIIWKDNQVALPIPPYSNAELQDEILAEVDPKDAYSVFMSAALIKAWYASLREPIFPPDSYRDLKRLYGDSQDVPDLARLTDLFSLTSEWSLLSGGAREILTRHLLPLLSAVAARQEQNKMTPENLAVCFAPALLCGPDQLEDAKMSSIIRRVLTQAVENWAHGLREACGRDANEFMEELQLPKDEHDWEDPVEGKRSSKDNKEAAGSKDNRDSLEEQSSGILLQDNEKLPTYPEEDEFRPPLPPRSQAPSTKSSVDSTRRKPAPPLVVPPRYSTIVPDRSQSVTDSPIDVAAVTDGFAPQRPDNDNDVGPPLPPRWDASTDEKKSGTIKPVSHVSASARYHAQDEPACPVSTFASKLNLPKRKTLTAAQIDNVEKSNVAQDQAPKVSEVQRPGSRYVQGGFALPGLTTSKLNNNDRSSNTPSPKSAVATSPSGEATSPTPLSAVSAPAADGFRRPSIPASASRSPSFTSLARPLYPGAQTPSAHFIPPRPPTSSKPVPTPVISTTRLRSPSASLLQRMPSFERSGNGQDGGAGLGASDPSCSVRRMLTPPKKLNLKNQSVEDLRRLYEERAGTANAIIEAGRAKGR